MKKGFFLILIIILMLGMISCSAAVPLEKKTIKIDGVSHLTKYGINSYSTSAFNGKVIIDVSQGEGRVSVNVSGYKKLVKYVKHYNWYSFRTNFDSYGRPSTTELVYKDSTKSTEDYFIKNTKKSNGYYMEDRQAGYYPEPHALTSIDFYFEKQPDLKISKISKSGNYRYVTVKNYGTYTSKANKIGVYSGNKLISNVSIVSIKPGEYKKVKVKIPTKYAKSSKKFKVDYLNKITEIYENNNVKSAK